MSRMPKKKPEKSGTCRMCLEDGPLENSHVVPSFVWRWLKNTSALGYLRTGENPNLRVQDGWKRQWFCRACEDQIGRFEKAFSEKFFPLVVTERPVPYAHGPWLSRFIASVALRTVMLCSERGEAFDLFTPEQKALLPSALEWWRAFVHGEAKTPGVHELHFMPMGAFSDYQGDRTLPTNINRYTLRAVEVHVAGSATQAFAFVKMGPAVALGFIQPPPLGQWKGTRVALREGQVGGRMTVPVQFLDFYIARARKARALLRGRSIRQKEKVQKAFQANLDRLAASETFRAVDADVGMFGIDRAFADGTPENGDVK